jgi:hypothetical protein
MSNSTTFDVVDLTLNRFSRLKFCAWYLKNEKIKEIMRIKYQVIKTSKNKNKNKNKINKP